MKVGGRGGAHHSGQAVSRGGELGWLGDVLGDGGVARDLAQGVGLLGRCWFVAPGIAGLGLAQSSGVRLHHLTGWLAGWLDINW